MDRTVNVLVFAASLRHDSINSRLTTLLSKILEEKGAVVRHTPMFEFDCPSYDQDDEKASMPEGATHLREALVACDAFMISSPEYNGSMPGNLKNTIDWVSRFRPQPFNGKQAFLLSASPSMAGGNRGLWALRVPLEHLGARVYPDMYSLAQAHTAFAENGRIANDMLQQRLESTVGCFLELVEAAKHYPALKKQWVEFLGEKPDAATDRVETAASS